MNKCTTPARQLVSESITLSLLSLSFLMMSSPAKADEVTIDSHPPVALILLDNLMSGRSHDGDTVHYEVVAPVFDADQNLIVPAGSFATGRVTRSKGSGMFGKRGELDFTCEFVSLPSGQNVPLTGSRIGGNGANDTATTAAVTVLVSPLGLLIKGGTIKYDRGTPIVMYVAEGAQVTPSDPHSADLTADIALKDKGSKDVFGTVTGFDGNGFQVSGNGSTSTVALDDVSNISVDSPANQGG